MRLDIEKNIKKNIYFLESDFQVDSQGKINLNFNLHDGASLNIIFLLTGEKVREFILDINLVGEAAVANIRGFYVFGASNKIIKIISMQKHLVKNTYSDLKINGVLLDGVNLEYSGKMFVDKDAELVKASLQNKNILLGQNVSLQASPELEILNNDVECKHGCAIGKFDKEQLFYLRSRGCSKDEAEKVLLEGFLNFYSDLSFNNNLSLDEEFCSKNYKEILEKIFKKIYER